MGLPALTGALVEALPRVLRELPEVVHGLNVVVRELGRMAAPDGEITALFREAARLAATRADERAGDAAKRHGGKPRAARAVRERAEAAPASGRARAG